MSPPPPSSSSSTPSAAAASRSNPSSTTMSTPPPPQPSTPSAAFAAPAAAPAFAHEPPPPPLLLSADASSLSEVQASLSSLQLSGSFTDVVFACPDGRTEAHKAVLEPRSQMLRNLFRINAGCCGCRSSPGGLPLCSSGQAEIATIILPDFSVRKVQEVLQLLYTGQVNNISSSQDMKQLHDLCKSLRIKLTLESERVEISTVLEMPSHFTEVSVHPVRSRQKRFSCQECGDKFVSNAARAAHWNETHYPEQDSSGKKKRRRKVMKSDEEASGTKNPKTAEQWYGFTGFTDEAADEYVVEGEPVVADPDVEEGEEDYFDPLQFLDTPLFADSGEERSQNPSGGKEHLTCPTCSAVYKKASRVIEHMAAIHLKDDLLGVYATDDGKGCSLCGFKGMAIARHVAVVHGRMTEFVGPRELEWLDKHWKRRNGGGGEKSSGKKVLQIRKKKKTKMTRKRKVNNKAVLESPGGGEPVSAQDKKFSRLTCPSCPRTYKMNYSVVQHLSESHMKAALLEYGMEGRICRFCGLEPKDLKNAARHVGVVHECMSEFADEDQREWLDRFWDSRDGRGGSVVVGDGGGAGVRNTVAEDDDVVGEEKGEEVEEEEGEGAAAVEGGSQVRFECTKCCEPFSDVGKLMEHLKVHHSVEEEQEEEEQEEEDEQVLVEKALNGTVPSKDETDFDLTCQTCSDDYSDEEEPEAVKGKGEDKQVLIDKVSNVVAAGVVTKELDSLKCPTCSETFPNPDEVTEHLIEKHLKDRLLDFGFKGRGGSCAFCQGRLPEGSAVAARHAGLIHGGLGVLADQEQAGWMKKFMGALCGRIFDGR